MAALPGREDVAIPFFERGFVAFPLKGPHKHLRFVRRVSDCGDFQPSRACGEVTFLAICARFKQHFGRFLGSLPPGACRSRGVLFGRLFGPAVRVSGDFRNRPAGREESFFC